MRGARLFTFSVTHELAPFYAIAAPTLSRLLAKSWRYVA